MKFNRLVCANNIFGLSGSPRTIMSPEHKIEYIKDMQCFIIDGKILVPMFKVNEALLEEVIESKPIKK